MRELFEKLKGLNFEDGAKLIRTEFPNIKERMEKDSDSTLDFDFIIDGENYFHYRTSYEAVEDDAPNVDLVNGYWGVMIDGNHLTHI